MIVRPILVQALTALVLAVLVCSTPLAAQVDRPAGSQPQGAPRGAPNAQPARRFQQIQKPADPDKVRGTFELGGKTHDLTEGSFYETYEILKPHDEKPQRPLQEQQVLEHILLFAEAAHMGFGLSDEEKDLINPLKTNKAFSGAIKQRLEAWKITEEQYVRYLAEKQTIQRLKDWYANSVRVRSSEVYDLWKRDNFLYRLAYLEFPAKAYEGELRQNKPTDAELETFYKTNPQVQNDMRVPTSVTADLLIFDPSTISAEELKALQGERVISRDESLAYFVKNRNRLVRQIRSEDRPKLYPPAGEAPKPVEELVTPFMLLQEQIARELVLGNRIWSAYQGAEEATKTEDFVALAKKHGLRHIRLDKASRQQVLNDHADLGPALFTDLFNAQAGSICSTIQFNGPTQYFWRLEDKAVSSLPAFAEVKEELHDAWYTFTAYQRAQEAATALLGKIEDAVKVESAEKEKEIDLKYASDAEKAIKANNYTGQRADAERQKARNFAENDKRTLRSQLMPKHFEATVKGAGETLKELGPFSFTFGRHDRSKIKDVELNKKTYLETSFQIKALGLDNVSPILSDVVTRTHFIVKVVAKDEPPFERMSPVDYHQRRMAAERQSTFTTNYMWTGFQAQRRLNWKAN